MRLYNSLTKQIESFKPITPGVVNMYCCGVTVYDYAHLGHARCYITWDVLRRYLVYKGYKVNYVQNFTDIDEKIITRARREGLDYKDLTEFYINAFIEDSNNLNILPATQYPRATLYISSVHSLIQELISKGYAYSLNRDILFSTKGLKDYGKLSNRTTKEGGDFAIWKSYNHYPYWESPWGNGRPGWHIECSAMIDSLFNGTIDIHMGGSDLKFPHHENEIAQSEAANNQPLANYWLHNGMITVNGKKMGKSLGNFITIRDLLKSYNPNVIRLFILQSNYTKPLDFTLEAINNSSNSWNTLYKALSFGQSLDLPYKLNQEFINLFEEALDDNFNTSEALSYIFSLAKDINTQANLYEHSQPLTQPLESIYSNFITISHLLNVLGFDTNINIKPNNKDLDIQDLIDKRNKARANKDWVVADSIRQELLAASIKVIDLPDGSSTFIRLN